MFASFLHVLQIGRYNRRVTSLVPPTFPVPMEPVSDPPFDPEFNPDIDEPTQAIDRTDPAWSSYVPPDPGVKTDDDVS